MRLGPLALLILVTPSLALAQRDAKIPDPDPEIERKTFVLPEGFEVNLFAADPMLAKPIQMNFDPQGRLWVASSEVYPQIEPGQKANDRVLILEDKDGDGRADKTTLFADGLLIPTGVLPGDGGAYVADSTDLVHFSDPDPKTGKATTKRIVLSGFGTEDTHHILHTLRWGPAGAMTMNQSVYIHSHIETPFGPRRLNAGGVWHFRPETGKLDVFAHGLWNSWGTAFDKFGRSFWTDGAGGQGINILMPGVYADAAYNPPRLLPGLNPGSPKYCGLAVVSGRHFPPEYDGSLLTNDFRGHRVCRFVLKEDGSGYVSKQQQDLIKSDHPAFRPIDIAMGPDGAVYVADWYNPIIQHGEVDFRDPRRDKTHGRIWRITAKNRPLAPRPQLAGKPVAELLAALESPEQYTRQMARQLLKERGPKEVLPAVRAWAETQDEPQQLEALWVVQSVGATDAALLDKVLTAKDYRVRQAGCRVVAAWKDDLPGGLTRLAKAVADDNPQVRLEAVRALADFPTLEAVRLAASALDKPVDPWLDYALFLTLRELAPVWLPEVRAGKFNFNGDSRHLVFALKAAGSGDIVGPLLALARNKTLPEAQRQAAWKTIAQVGNAAELAVVFNEGKFAEPAGYWPEVMGTLVDSLAARRGKINPAPWAGLTGAIGDPAVKAAALRLAGLTKSEGLRPQLEAEFAAADPIGEAAADGLVALGGQKSIAFFGQQFAGGPNRQRAVVALAELDVNAAAPLAAQLLADAKPAGDPTPVYAAFLGRKGGPAALAKALAGAKLPADTARLGVRAANGAAQPEAALIAALTKAGNLTAAGWNLSGDELTAFLDDVPKLGDAARGESVYRRANLNCVKCHAIAGAGGQVGPDLSSIGGSAQVDYLVESLLKPNAKVKEGYNTLIVATVDDRVVSGIKARESPTELVLRDAENRLTAIPTADIAERRNGQSLMPAGQVDQLTRQELLDLTRFLSQLGKGEYAATPGAVVRNWQVLTPTKAMYDRMHRDRFAVVATNDPALTWAPLTSRVNGSLNAGDAPAFQWTNTAPMQSVVRLAIDVTTPGAAALKIAEPKGLTLWLDGQPLDAAATVPLTLSAGPHTVTFAIEWQKRGKPLRVELGEVSGSPARVRLGQASGGP